MFSDFRCNLWKDARARLRKNPPEITSDMRNSHLLPILYAEIMKLDGEVSLVVGDDAKVETPLVLLADAKADEAAIKTAIADGELDLASCQAASGFCKGNLNEFGQLIDERVRGLEAGGRAEIARLAANRFCVVRDDFPNRPALPKGSCEPRGRTSTPKSTESSGGLEDFSDFVQPAMAISREVRLIPDADAAGVASTVEITSGSHETFVGSISVRVQIDHSWRGDVMLVLTSPDGTVFPVTEFDPDDSANDIDDEFMVFGFDDAIGADGPWTLTAIDSASGERGHLLGWSLGINTNAPQIAAEGTRVAPR